MLAKRILVLPAIAVLATLASACGGGSSPASAGTKSQASPMSQGSPVSSNPATSEPPAASPSDSAASQTGQSGTVTVSGALNGTFVPVGHYGCLPIQAIGGQVNGTDVLLGVGNGRVSLGVDAGANPGLWAGLGVSMNGSAYVFDATLQPGPGTTGEVTISGSMPCG